MFRETDRHTQLDAFSSADSLLSGRSLSFYQDKSSWHNLFRKEVLMRLDEGIFRVLFCKDNGAPNVSVRVLVCMMILKESQGLSDAQLFEQCRYNILTRSALGLVNITDSIPAESTYYLFRNRIVEYEKEKGENLLEKAFRQVTLGQIKDYNVSGKQLRMDSKLICSNISWYSRYELIHETVRIFYKNREEYIKKRSLPASDIALLESLSKENGDKVVYRSSKEDITIRMKQLGVLIHRLLNLFKKYPGDDYDTLKKVFEEQFSVGKKKEILPLEKEQIKATSVQSPHDTDCDFRNKDGNKVKGYSVNVSETCDKGKDKLNLVTDVQVDKVTTADCDFLASSVDNSQEILTDKIEKVHTDGAYHSPENQDFCKEKEIEFITSAIQGAEPRYELSFDENNEELIVKDRKTEQIIPAKKITSRKDESVTKWVIKTSDNKSRYFTEKDVKSSILRQKISQTPRDELNIRNNVEATIFQLGYHYPNDKSRYRTLCKHKMWAFMRVIGINFRRILKYVTQICQRPFFMLNTITSNHIEHVYLTFIIIFNHIFTYDFSRNSKKQVFPVFL